jgi:glycosyltransferase involved in cell wall biosynthesis
MPAPLLLDLSHTSHSRARTGIQRVSRSLHTALGDRAVAVTYDPHRKTWRELAPWEVANVTASDAADKRGAQWPLRVRLRARAERILRQASIDLPVNSGAIFPEVFSPTIARSLPHLRTAIRGARMAIFHDAIALKLPELTPPATVARFPAYLLELLEFDAIAAVSEDSRSSLLEYWRWLGVGNHPPVRAISLGISPRHFSSAGEISPAEDPVVLSIGSIEGRKNHLALLDACEQLWRQGERFRLRLIGLANAKTGGAALAKLRALQIAGCPISYDGPVADAAVDAAYAACAFTVYPSFIEGFGLPVIESLAHGKPCICSAHGALGESAAGGGCIPLPSMDASSLATAIARLVQQPAEIAELSRQARARRFKTWDEYANELVAWTIELHEVTAGVRGL